MAYLELDSATLRSRLGRAPFRVAHRLAGHELFSLPRLVELAQCLPADKVEYNAGDVPVSLDPAATPRNGLTAAETIRRIEECRSWLVLKNVERDPAYRQLLEACLAEVRSASPALTGGMRDQEAFVFVSSPGSITPYHMDPEENFLLQIRGRKTMNLFDPADRSILSEREIEGFFNGAHRNLVFRRWYQQKARQFELAPGVGVHVPVTAPHWVRNGPAVSISFSITFRTRASMRLAQAHRFNADLRRLGLRPTSVGESALRDALKGIAFRARSRAARALGLEA